MTTVVEEIDPEDWQVREVYATFGLAMYMAQVVEYGIINLVVLSGLRDGRYRAYEEIDAANAELFRQTMGSVKKTLLSRRPDITHLDEILIRAVRLRNFLAHEYFRQRVAAFMGEDGQNQMIEELKTVVAFFQEVNAKLKSLVMEIMEAKGIDKYIPEEMELARQEGVGDPLPGLGG